MNFAKAIVSAPVTSSAATKNPTYESAALVALYKGFAATSVNEPPFLVGGFEFKKIAEDVDSQTILINNSVTLRIFLRHRSDLNESDSEIEVDDPRTRYAISRGLSFRPDTSVTYRVVSNALAEKTGMESKNIGLLEALNDLPFMEHYVNKQPFENPGLFNVASAKHPLTEEMHRVGGNITVDTFGGLVSSANAGLYLDGFNRYFVTDRNGIRLYLDSPMGTPKVVTSWDPKTKEFKPYQVQLPREEEPVYFGGCFTAATPVALADGSKMTIAALYEKYQSSEPLPKVSVYNPDTQETIAQTPMVVSRQYRPDDQAVQFITVAEGSRPIEVTPNHFLWIRRLDREYWIPSAQVAIGDELLLARTGDKQWARVLDNTALKNDTQLAAWRKGHPKMVPSFSFEAIVNRAAQGALDVYNVTFEPEGLHYTNYAVDTGAAAVVVHNLFIK